MTVKVPCSSWLTTRFKEVAVNRLQALPECTTCGAPFATPKAGKRPAAASPPGGDCRSKQAH